MTVGDLVLLVELAAPLFMVGVIWAVQILNYAPMTLVGWEDATGHLKSIRRTAAYDD